MQETQVRSLIQEDPICLGATKPISHNYWDCALRSQELQFLKPTHLEPLHHNKRSHHSEKPTYRESSPHALELEKALTEMKTQHSQK